MKVGQIRLKAEVSSIDQIGQDLLLFGCKQLFGFLFANSRLPLWAAILLFLAWGFLMWKLWKWVDRRGQKGEKDEKED